VTDINDNRPVFASSQYSFFTVESYDLNTNIGEVRATDQDSGVNGEIDYTIVSIDPAPRSPGLKIIFVALSIDKDIFGEGSCPSEVQGSLCFNAIISITGI
jgi:hypothetical protein